MRRTVYRLLVTLSLPALLAAGPAAAPSNGTGTRTGPNPDAAASAQPVSAAQDVETPAKVPPGAQAALADQPLSSPQRQAMLRTQVLLDRAHYSPGVIDALNGDNVQNAAKAYRAAHSGLGEDLGQSIAQAGDGAPIVTQYTITPEDVAGPFAPVPRDFKALAETKHTGYSSPLEELAERFHASQKLLKELNPQADFAKAGTQITVPNVARDGLPSPVAKIEVDKSLQVVRAYDGSGQLEATYPATVGSTERPAPSGLLKVKGVAKNPNYTYDPSRLTFGKRTEGKLIIPPGPNNPVGSTWIALNRQTYGIHGTPDPQLVGKRASHGCVRLTNWDAAELGRAVKPGVPVDFVGTEQRAS